MLTPASTIAILGFGALGQRLTAQLSPRGCSLRVHDDRLDADATRADLQQCIEAAGADPAASVAAALHGAKLVIATTGSPAAQLQRGQIYLDFAADRDAQREQHARLVEVCGAHHVAAVATPGLQLCGHKALELATALQSLGLSARAVAMLPAATAVLQSPAAIMPATLRRGELP
jgi:threonine dehydrogenase-like Zn-dependent dehydrogenase